MQVVKSFGDITERVRAVQGFKLVRLFLDLTFCIREKVIQFAQLCQVLFYILHFYIYLQSVQLLSW